LEQRLFFADQGIFHSGDYYQMMNWARCLSLLSNAVLGYNTLRIVRVLERTKAQGQAFRPEAIAYVLPLGRRHVIVNETYGFSSVQGALANLGAASASSTDWGEPLISPPDDAVRQFFALFERGVNHHSQPPLSTLRPPRRFKGQCWDMLNGSIICRYSRRRLRWNRLLVGVHD
jgi:hypothetical protein